MKISDNQYLYRLETQNENGEVVEYQEIETVEPLRSVRDVHDEIDLENNKQIKSQQAKRITFASVLLTGTRVTASFVAV